MPLVQFTPTKGEITKENKGWGQMASCQGLGQIDRTRWRGTPSLQFGQKYKQGQIPSCQGLGPIDNTIPQQRCIQQVWKSSIINFSWCCSLWLTKNKDVSFTDGPVIILAFDEAHMLTEHQGAKCHKLIIMTRIQHFDMAHKAKWSTAWHLIYVQGPQFNPGFMQNIGPNNNKYWWDTIDINTVQIYLNYRQ